MTFDPSHLKILFFDVGNVFVSDDPSGCFAYHSLYQYLAAKGVVMSEEEFFRRRTEHVRKGGSLWSFVSEYIPENDFRDWQRAVRMEMYAQWAKLSPPVPGMEEAALELARHYRLGMIANQPPEVADVLEQRGLLDLFEVHGISGAVGFEKPDPRLFEWALDAANVRPEEAMMIGDRVDNDVAPAKAIGMRTAWMKLDARARGWKPESVFQQCYAASLAESNWSHRAPASSDEQPDLIVESPAELVRQLLPVADETGSGSSRLSN